MVPACSDKVSRVSSYSGYCLALTTFEYEAFTPSGRPFHAVLLAVSIDYTVLTPGSKLPGLGSSAFARRYLRNRYYFLFLRLLRCFSSPGSLRMPMYSAYGDWLCQPGSPIRRSADHCSCAAPRGFSQLITPFIGSQCQGIRPAPFLA